MIHAIAAVSATKRSTQTKAGRRSKPGRPSLNHPSLLPPIGRRKLAPDR